MKLTTAVARNLQLPLGKNGRIKNDHIEFDDDFPGFGVRLRLNDKGKNALLASTAISRTWVYQYDFAGRTRRMTIGNVIAIGIEDARKIAGQHQSKVRLGDDPAKEKTKKLERAVCTFANALSNFIAVKKQTTRRWRPTELVLTKNCQSLYPMSLPDITRRDIANVLTPIAARGKMAQSNNVRGKLITFFNWAIEQGLLESNPVLGTGKHEAKSRDRVLSMVELVAISQAVVAMTDFSAIVHLSSQLKTLQCGLIDYGDLIHLLMLTGQRCSEISELQWRETRNVESFIDDGLPIAGPALVLPAERVKNGHKHIVPLSKPAQAILFSRQRESGLVFPHKLNDEAIWQRKWTRHKKLLDATLIARGHKLEHFVLHDLRRSVATHMGNMGFHRETIDSVLNHYRADVYNKSRYEREKRQALEAWGEYLMAHIEGRTPADNVVRPDFLGRSG